MRAAWVAIIFAMGAVWLIAPSSAVADRQRLRLPQGVFVRSHTIDYFDGKKMVKAQTKDVLKLWSDRAGNLEFCFELIFNNGHSCHMTGKLLKIGPSTWEHREKLETGEQCTLRITYAGRGIIIEDVSKSCRSWYCGARGSIGHHFSVQDKGTVPAKTACDQGS